MFNLSSSIIFRIFLIFASANLISCSKKVAVESLVESEVINIQDFGAIPNDKKDDSEAIQAAINEAIQSKKSSWVYCPPGVYDLDKGVVIANQKKKW